MSTGTLPSSDYRASAVTAGVRRAYDPRMDITTFTPRLLVVGLDPYRVPGP